jgi:hypothetical protein
MALGLGEMPSEALLEPAGTEPEAAPAELEAPAELQAFLEDMQVQPEAAVEAPAVEEPAVEAPAAKPELLAAEAEPEALVIEPESLEIGPETLVIEPEALEIEEAPGEPTPDLSDLLSSLEEDQLAEAPPEIVKTEAFEEEMEEPQEPSAGVISTDAYLADISSEGLGMGLSGGLGDELSALTGAGRPQRPSASVKKIPEPGAPLELRRDQTVDKDLILKIIHGLENL